MKRLMFLRMFESFEYPDFCWILTGSFTNFIAILVFGDVSFYNDQKIPVRSVQRVKGDEDD